MPLAFPAAPRRLALSLLVSAVPILAARAQSPGASPATIDDLQKQIMALQHRVDELENLAVVMRTLAARIDRLQQIQRAQAALDDGRPLGPIPDAPPALARFADTPPPTLSSLRAAYPAAAHAAREASDGAEPSTGFLAGMWSRVQSLITVEQGNRVLVGSPASRILARARSLLEDGDLPGALGALDQLDPAAKRAMAGWIGQAQALVEARAALATASR